MEEVKQCSNWVAAPNGGLHNEPSYRHNNDKTAEPTLLDQTGRIGQNYRPARWSVIPESRHKHELQALKERYRSLEELQRHNYLLSPHSGLRQEYQDCRASRTNSGSDSTGQTKRKAVAMTYQMAGLHTRDVQMHKLFLLCAVDYLTREVLISNFVRPLSGDSELRTRYRNVTAVNKDGAVEKFTVLNGLKATVAKLWEIIDAETILVGHSLKNDLELLKLVHTKIVDSSFLVSKALGSFTGIQPTLDDLCKQCLGLTLPNKKQNRDKCLEDVMAARELVLWCVNNPVGLKEWGRGLREEEHRRKEAKEKASRGEKARREEKARKEEIVRREEKTNLALSKTAKEKALTMIAKKKRFAKRTEDWICKRMRVQNSESLGIGRGNGQELPQRHGPYISVLRETGPAKSQEDKGMRGFKRSRNQVLDDDIELLIRDVLAEEASGQSKRLKLTPKANKEPEDQGLLSGASLNKASFRLGRPHTTLPEPFTVSAATKGPSLTARSLGTAGNFLRRLQPTLPQPCAVPAAIMGAYVTAKSLGTAVNFLHRLHPEAIRHLMN